MSPQALVGAQCEAGDLEQPIRSGARKFLGHAQFAPVVGQDLDIRDSVQLVGLVEPLESLLAHHTLYRRRGDEGHKRFDRTIDGATEGA